MGDSPYVVDRRQHYEWMRDWLPSPVHAILDIGSGPAFTDVWLVRHYGVDAVVVHLMDNDHHVPAAGKNQVGMRPVMTPWKDRNVGIANLLEHEPRCDARGCDADPSLTVPCDLIVSFRSWGFHYPVTTYLSLAKRSLSDHGRIIVDLRRGASGLAAFDDAGFESLAIIGGGSHKCDRHVLARRA